MLNIEFVGYVVMTYLHIKYDMPISTAIKWKAKYRFHVASKYILHPPKGKNLLIKVVRDDTQFQAPIFSGIPISAVCTAHVLTLLMAGN
jgi:hypothetical protein